MFYFISCSIIWGLTWIAIKYQFGAVDPNVAVFYRFITASLILFVFTYFKNINLKYPRQDHINFLAQGFFMFCLNYLLTYWASQLTPSALAALAFTALIYFNILGGKIFLKIPLNRQVLLGAFISFAGMGLISFNELAQQDLHPTSFIGFLISLVATMSASAGNLISTRSRTRNVPISANNAWGMLYGSFFTLTYCLLTRRNFAFQYIDQAFIWSFIYLTIFGTILSFGAYLKLIEIMGPSKAAFTSVISPIIAVSMSVVFEKLPLTMVLFVGICLCLLGNLIALTPKHFLNIKKYVH